MADIYGTFVYGIFNPFNSLDERKKKIGLLNTYGVVKAMELWDSGNNSIISQFDWDRLDYLLASYAYIWNKLDYTPTNVNMTSQSASNRDINEWNAVDMLIYSGRLKIEPTGNPLTSVPIQIRGNVFIDTTTGMEYPAPFQCNDYRGIHYNNVYIYSLTRLRVSPYVDMYDSSEPITTEALTNSYISYLHGRDLYDMGVHGKHIARGIMSCDALQNLLDTILTRKNDEFTEEDSLDMSIFTSAEITLSVPFDDVVKVRHIRMEPIYDGFNLSNLFSMVLFTKGIFFTDRELANKLTDNQFDSDVIIRSKYTDKYILNSRDELLFRNFYEYKPDTHLDVICIKETRHYKGKNIDGYALYSPYNIPMSLPKTDIPPVGGGGA